MAVPATARRNSHHQRMNTPHACILETCEVNWTDCAARERIRDGQLDSRASTRSCREMSSIQKRTSFFHESQQMNQTKCPQTGKHWSSPRLSKFKNEGTNRILIGSYFDEERFETICLICSSAAAIWPSAKYDSTTAPFFQHCHQTSCEPTCTHALDYKRDLKKRNYFDSCLLSHTAYTPRINVMERSVTHVSPFELCSKNVMLGQIIAKDCDERRLLNLQLV